MIDLYTSQGLICEIKNNTFNVTGIFLVAKGIIDESFIFKMT